MKFCTDDICTVQTSRVKKNIVVCPSYRYEMPKQNKVQKVYFCVENSPQNFNIKNVWKHENK